MNCTKTWWWWKERGSWDINREFNQTHEISNPTKEDQKEGQQKQEEKDQEDGRMLWAAAWKRSHCSSKRNSG